jgi:hypothetical protein
VRRHPKQRFTLIAVVDENHSGPASTPRPAILAFVQILDDQTRSATVNQVAQVQEQEKKQAEGGH